MTMREKAQGELRRVERELSNLKEDISQVAQEVARTAADDAFGMTPGLALAHATLDMASKGTRLREVQTRIDLLQWLLNEDEPL